MNINLDLESTVMKLIGNSGESRSMAFEALDEAKKGNFEKADFLLAESKKKILAAHEIQTDLIVEEASENKIELNLLMVHAQDHLMSAILAKDLIAEMIELYKKG